MRGSRSAVRARAPSLELDWFKLRPRYEPLGEDGEEEASNIEVLVVMCWHNHEQGDAHGLFSPSSLLSSLLFLSDEGFCAKKQIASPGACKEGA